MSANLLVTYPNSATADEVEGKMRETIGKKGRRWELEQVADRPAMEERRKSKTLAKALTDVAREWEIPLAFESSVWPSVAGLVPTKTACLCGVGPVARDIGSPNEAVQRISLIQRTLLLAEFLATE